jgi:hypothetical protein
MGITIETNLHFFSDKVIGQGKSVLEISIQTNLHFLWTMLLAKGRQYWEYQLKPLTLPMALIFSG